MKNLLTKVARWILFIPLLFLVLACFRVVVVWLQFWIKDQVHEDSGWAYFVASTTFSSFWIPYLLQYWAIIRVVKICPMVQVGSGIAFTIICMTSINYYFIQDHDLYLAGVLADLVTILTLGYTTFNRVEE